jgi:hypothetical protein
MNHRGGKTRRGKRGRGARKNLPPDAAALPPDLTTEGERMKIRQILFFGACMSALMSMWMSLAMTALNVGLNAGFAAAWLPSWLAGFVVSLPFSFFVPPLIRKLMDALNI